MVLETAIIITIIVCSTAGFIGTLFFKSKCTKVDINSHGIHAERNVKEELKDAEIPKIISL